MTYAHWEIEVPNEPNDEITPLTAAEVELMIGETVPVTAGFDWTKGFGRATVVDAWLGSNVVGLNIRISRGTADRLVAQFDDEIPKSWSVGYQRGLPGIPFRLREITAIADYNPTPVAQRKDRTVKQPESVEASAYLVIEPTWSGRRDEFGRPILAGAKIARVTQNLPRTTRGDALATRVTFKIDADALLPLQPSAIVHITANDVSTIEVEAEHPEEPEA